MAEGSAFGAALPVTPLAHVLGFQLLPTVFFATVAGMVVVYLPLVEIGKRIFCKAAPPSTPPRPALGHRHLRRRAARFSTVTRLPRPKATQ
ncbi:hypothetical protein ABZ547_37725 [Streptomyces sparsogenes]|uniref:hypothetical protein n=1 Tax=Streptomyces sparsogenes TaxID=67365 RepID=UPI0033CE7517